MSFSYGPNKYIGNLDSQAVQAAVDYCRTKLPNEAGGVITEGQFIPLRNESSRPKKYYLVKDPLWSDLYVEGKVQAFVHSHDYLPRATVGDQEQKIDTEVPWLFLNYKNNSLMDCILWDDSLEVPLEGRPFFFGVFDCLALVSDYMAREFQVEIPWHPHDWEFWEKGERPFEQAIEDPSLTFYSVEKPWKDFQIGDVLMYRVQSSVINHIGVVCNEHKEVLHHWLNRVSGRFPVNYQRKYLTKVMRLKS